MANYKIKSKKPIARCFDDEGGNEHQFARVHGYWFGDRLLEGVFFRLELDSEGYLIVSTAPECAAYMKNLNEKKWLAEAMRFSFTNDIFYSDDPDRYLELCFKDRFEE